MTVRVAGGPSRLRSLRPETARGIIIVTLADNHRMILGSSYSDGHSGATAQVPVIASAGDRAESESARSKSESPGPGPLTEPSDCRPAGPGPALDLLAPGNFRVIILHHGQSHSQCSELRPGRRSQA